MSKYCGGCMHFSTASYDIDGAEVGMGYGWCKAYSKKVKKHDSGNYCSAWR